MDCVQMYGTGNKTTKGQGNNGQLYIADGDTFTVESTDDGWKIAKVVFVAKTYYLNLTGTDVATGYPDDTYSQYIVQWPAKVNGYFVEDVEADPQQSVQFTSTGYSYISTVIVTLVSAAPAEPVTYTVNIVDAPEGATVTLDGKTMNSGDTYEVAKKLTTNDLIATETADYYAEKTYDEATHTFTVTYKEYLKYAVAVTGTEDANAGVVYNGVTYRVGDNVPAKTELISTDVTAAEVAGLEGTVTLNDKTFTVTYKKPEYIEFITTGLSSSYYNETKSGVTVYGQIYNNKLNAYKSYDNIKVSSTAGNIAKIVFTIDSSYGSGDLTLKTGGGSLNTSTNTWEGSASSVEFSCTNDRLITNVKVYLEAVEPTIYTVNFVNAPTGASATLEGQTFTEDGTTEPIEKNLTTDDLSVTNVEGYLYEKAYDATTHTFTVTYTELWPKANTAYMVKNVDANLYLNLRAREDKCAVLGEEPEALYFTYNYDKNAFTITNESGWYVGSHANDWNMAYNIAEYWVVKDLGNGTYAFQRQDNENKYIGFNYIDLSSSDPDRTAAFRDKGSSAHYAFTITEYVAPSNDYTFSFVGAPEGATVKIGEETFEDGDTYTATGKLTVNDIDASNADYNTTVTIEEGNVIKVVFSRNAYTVTLNGAPEGATITIGDKTYGDGDIYYTKNTITKDDITAAYDGYEVEVAVSEGAITVTYLKESTMGKTFTIAEISKSGSKYWTTFCYDRDFTLPEGYTACIITNAAESGALTIEELKGEATEGGSDTYSSSNSSVYTVTPQDSQMGEHTYTHVSGNTIITASNSSPGGFSLGQNCNLTCATTTGANITKIVVSYYNSSWNYFSDTYTPNAPTCDITFNEGLFDELVITYEGASGQPVIPANEGILISAAAPTTEAVEITPVKDATAVETTGNLLVGCTETATWEETGKQYYKLTTKNHELGSAGFYWAVDGGKSITANAGKAYLVLTDDQAERVRGFRLDGTTEGTTDGIDSINGMSDTTPVYNLNGQRMGDKLPAGVYVKGGKKFIVK